MKQHKNLTDSAIRMLLLWQLQGIAKSVKNLIDGNSTDLPKDYIGLKPISIAAEATVYLHSYFYA